jgi:hypothetical protein
MQFDAALLLLSCRDPVSLRITQHNMRVAFIPPFRLLPTSAAGAVTGAVSELLSRGQAAVEAIAAAPHHATYMWRSSHPYICVPHLHAAGTVTDAVGMLLIASRQQ